MTEYEIACQGKSRFPNRKTAKQRANEIRRTGGPAMRAYECRFGSHFHIGHRPGHATYLRRGQPLEPTR